MIQRVSCMVYVACSFFLPPSYGGISSKIVQQGESFVLFTNDDNTVEEITLYINGNNIVTWKVEDTVIKPYWKDSYIEFRKISMDSNKKIWIDNVDKSYERKYLISYSYSNFSRSLEVQLCIEAPLSVSIDNGKTLSTPINSNETITCSIFGSEILNITWTGPSGNKLTNSTKYSITSNIITRNSNLTILVLSMTDSGDYICHATNRFGSIVQDNIKLTVYEPLSVSIDNGDSVTGVSGGSLTISCSVSGTGTITVTWHNSGNILSCGQKYTIPSYNVNTRKASLTIVSLDKNDGGNYICRASDSNNVQLEGSIYVTVAVFTAEIKERTICASIGHDIDLNCSVTGSHQNVNWYLESTLLSDGQKYQMSQSRSSNDLFYLTIHDVQYSDNALYTCKAVSSIDLTTAASASVYLSIQDRCPHLEPDCKTSTYIIIAVIATMIFTLIVGLLIKKICAKKKSGSYSLRIQDQVWKLK